MRDYVLSPDQMDKISGFVVRTESEPGACYQGIDGNRRRTLDVFVWEAMGGEIGKEDQEDE